MYFLDANTCIYYLKGKFPNLRTRILALSPDEIKIPSVVKAELLLGAYKSTQRESNLEKIEAFLQPFEIMPFDDLVSYVYAEIRGIAESSGKVIGPNDLFIAATTKFHDGVLVTNNVRELAMIEGLKLENWAIEL